MINNVLIRIYKLDKIDSLDLAECQEALMLLKNLLSKYDNPIMKAELKKYITLVEARNTFVRSLPFLKVLDQKVLWQVSRQA